MHRRTTRGNRLGLALTGLALAVGGAALLAAHQGLYGAAGTHDPLYPVAAQRFVHSHGGWLWPLLAAAAVLVGLLFLRWLIVQPRTDRVRGLVIDIDPPDIPTGATDTATRGDDAFAGRTRMPAHAITDIVEDDIAELRGVRRVDAALSGHSDSPLLWLRVSTDAGADVARIRQAITDRVLPDARACLDLPDLPTHLRLNVTRRAAARDIT